MKRVYILLFILCLICVTAYAGKWYDGRKVFEGGVISGTAEFELPLCGDGDNIGFDPDCDGTAEVTIWSDGSIDMDGEISIGGSVAKDSLLYAPSGEALYFSANGPGKDAVFSADNSTVTFVGSSGEVTGKALTVLTESPSPDDNDIPATINLSGWDSGGNETIYGQFHVVADDVTGGTEDGTIYYRQMENGTLGAATALGGASGAPVDATYLTATLNGTLTSEVYVPATDDSVMLGNGSNWQIKTIPDCNAADETLNYDQATNAWSCGTDATGEGTPADADYLTLSPNATLTDEIPIGATDDSVLVADGSTVTLKVLPDCDSATDTLNYDQATNAFSCGTDSDSSGAPTDANYLVGSAHAGLSGETEVLPTDDYTLVGSGSSWISKGLPDCGGAGDTLNYTSSTNSFSCGTDAGIGAETNSLETTITGIADTEIFVGDGADSGAFVTMSVDATMSNTGAVTVVDDSHNHVITNIDTFTKAELATQTSDVADYAEADGDVHTGTHDFGGAVVELPNGASPTVDAIGETAIDSTSDQFIYYGSAKRVLIEEDCKSLIIENLAAADDNFSLGMFNYTVTITDVGIHCAGTCTTGADISLEDRAGNAMTHTVPTHSTGTGATTFQSVSAANLLTAGEGLQFDVDNAVSPETDTYTITYCYKATAD